MQLNILLNLFCYLKVVGLELLHHCQQSCLIPVKSRAGLLTRRDVTTAYLMSRYVCCHATLHPEKNTEVGAYGYLIYDSPEKALYNLFYYKVKTRGSAIAEEPRDALRQLKYYGRFLTELLTRSSANPEEPCEHTVS